MKLLAIAIGGATGALLRYGTTGWLQAVVGRAWPWGTPVVNLVGCAAFGMVAVFADVVEWPLRSGRWS